MNNQTKSYDEDATLISRIMNGQDAEGHPIYEEKTQEVWYRQKEITRAEFYQSQSTGISVKMIIAIPKDEMDDYMLNVGIAPSNVQLQGMLYKVIRQYSTGDETEIVLGG